MKLQSLLYSYFCIYAICFMIMVYYLFGMYDNHDTSFIFKFEMEDENSKTTQDILLFHQPIGSVTRHCSKKDLVIDTYDAKMGHNCWLPNRITITNHRLNEYTNHRSVNGPMPILIRSWMKELNSAFEAYSTLVFVSSHVPVNNHEQETSPLPLSLIGFNAHDKNWEIINFTMSFPSYNPCQSVHSPSVAIDDDHKIMYMYIHGHKCKQKPSNVINFQPTLLLKSNNGGISWELSTSDDLIHPPYLLWDLFYLSIPRYSHQDGYFYAIAKTQEDPEGSSILCRSKLLSGPFEKGPLLSKGTRHTDLHIIHRRNKDDQLHTYFLVFFTMIGDSAEKVILGNIDISMGYEEWMQWHLLPGPIILKPTYWYEHGGAAAKPSKPGAALIPLHELRDPHFLRKEEGEMINTNILSGTLFYTVQGEQGIAIADVRIDLKAYFEDSLLSYRDFSNILPDVLTSTSLEDTLSKNKSLLITGVGRSGTTSLCVLFQSMGLNLSHDNDYDCGPYPGPDGAVSWYDAFKDEGGKRYSNVVHLTRDPLKVIDSRAHKAIHQHLFLIEKLGTYEESTDLIRQNFSLADGFKFSLKHWVRRNSFVESYASWRTQIELISHDPFSVWQLCLAGDFGYRCPSLTVIQQKLSALPSDLNSNYANTTKSKLQMIKGLPEVQNHTKLTWASLQDIVGLENHKYIKIAQVMAKRYGYADSSIEDSVDTISYFCQFTDRRNNVGFKWDCLLSQK